MQASPLPREPGLGKTRLARPSLAPRLGRLPILQDPCLCLQDPAHLRGSPAPSRAARAGRPTHWCWTPPSQPRPSIPAPAERVKPRDLPGRGSACRRHEGPNPSALKEPRPLPSWRSPVTRGPARGPMPPAAPPHPPPLAPGYERGSRGTWRGKSAPGASGFGSHVRRLREKEKFRARRRPSVWSAPVWTYTRGRQESAAQLGGLTGRPRRAAAPLSPKALSHEEAPYPSFATHPSTRPHARRHVTRAPPGTRAHGWGRGRRGPRYRPRLRADR